MNVAALREAEARVWASVGATPREHRVSLPSLGTTVRVLEVGTGPPVLFVHGTSVAATSWADLVARLDGFRCLLLDRPGCGLSDPIPDGGDVDGFLRLTDRLVPAVLDGLELPTASVVATSVGGMFAVRGAAARPDRVRRLVLFGWTLGTPNAPARMALRVGSVRPLARLAAALPANRRSVRTMVRGFGMRRAIDEGHLSDVALDWLVTLFRETDTLRNEALAGPRLVTLRGWDPRLIHDEQLLARVRAPTCLIHGTDDPFGSVQAIRGLAAAMPDAEVHVLGDVGHAPWLDETDRVVALTEQFLGARR